MAIDLAPLLNLGAVGVVLAWLMFRVERRMDRMAASLDRVSRALLMEILSRPGVSLSVTKEAQTLLTDMREHRENAGR